jgi:uncharacterized protein YgbK (DUF1537 family)
MTVVASVLVVADDLTGANATGARFARLGMRSVTVRDPAAVGQVVDDYDVVVVNTDSRHVSAAEAAARVRTAVETAGAVPLVVKRIDTTLRGNLGAETEHVLRAVSALHPNRRVRALVLPAFPETGRVTVGGMQLLHGLPLERTELARDPLCPMTTSVVVDIFAAQTDLAVRQVPLPVVAQGGAPLVAALAGEEPLVVCDALEASHIDAVAAAAVQHDVVWVAVDPGPGGAALAAALGLPARASRRPCTLVVSGSASDLTRRQLIEVEARLGCRFVDADVRGLDAPAYREELVDAIVEACRTAGPGGLGGVRTVAGDADVVSDPALGRRIPGLLAELVPAVLDRVPVGGLYLTGGDVTTNVFAALGVTGMEVETEVAPLAVAGTTVGGPRYPLSVVTKGGLVGDPATAAVCLERLRAMVERQREQVHAPWFR